MYSFYELFAHYAKHLERFYATSETPDWCAYEFHQLLLEGIGFVTQERYHSPPPSGMLSPLLLTTRGLEEMTSAALQRGCQS